MKPLGIRTVLLVGIVFFVQFLNSTHGTGEGQGFDIDHANDNSIEGVTCGVAGCNKNETNNNSSNQGHPASAKPLYEKVRDLKKKWLLNLALMSGVVFTLVFFCCFRQRRRNRIREERVILIGQSRHTVAMNPKNLSSTMNFTNNVTDGKSPYIITSSSRDWKPQSGVGVWIDSNNAFKSSRLDKFEYLPPPSYSTTFQNEKLTNETIRTRVDADQFSSPPPYKS